MSDPRSDDYEPGLPADERERLDELANRLVRDRPLPRPAFRGDLGRRLTTVSRTSVKALRVRAVAFVAAGAVLLGVAGLGALDAGPLAPTHDPPTNAQAIQLR